MERGGTPCQEQPLQQLEGKARASSFITGSFPPFGLRFPKPQVSGYRRLNYENNPVSSAFFPHRHSILDPLSIYCAAVLLTLSHI